MNNIYLLPNPYYIIGVPNILLYYRRSHHLIIL